MMMWSIDDNVTILSVLYVCFGWIVLVVIDDNKDNDIIVNDHITVVFPIWVLG